MTTRSDIELLPVLRRPRGKWQIPIFQTPEQKAAEEQNERRLRALIEGTTPYGREIFRRTLSLAGKLFEQNIGFGQAAKRVAEELETFSELRSEFVLLLTRITKDDPANLNGCSSLGLAMAIIMHLKTENAVDKAANSAPSHQENYE
jgi:hypothetical protein